MSENIKHLIYMLEMAYKEKKNLKLNYMQCKELLDDINMFIENNTSEKKESKKKYGEYKHVKLTDKEFDSLMDCYGLELGADLITYLDEYIEMKGYKAKNHYLCIKKWVVDAVKEQKNKSNRQSIKEEKTPDWLDKEIKSKKVTAEEIAEMEELLKEFI